MGLSEMIEEHVTTPRREMLEQESENLDMAVKRFEKIIELDNEENMQYFLDIISKKKDKVEETLLSTSTPPNIREQCIGEMRALSDVLKWKSYYVRAISFAKESLKKAKEELETGERPDDQPND